LNIYYFGTVFECLLERFFHLFVADFYSWLSPHAGGHRNCNVAPLATEKKCCALFFLLRFAGTVPKEATNAVTGGYWEWGFMRILCVWFHSFVSQRI
jgi:hypothetical protein